MFNINAESAVFVCLSLMLGAAIGWYSRNILVFVASLIVAPLVIAGGYYLADVIQLRGLGRSSGESWAGLAIPFLSAGAFAYIAPTAIGVALLKWLIGCFKENDRSR